MPIFSSKGLLEALLLVIVPATSAYRAGAKPYDFDGIRRDIRDTRKRVVYLQRCSLCCPAGRRLALAASGTCHTLDWHA